MKTKEEIEKMAREFERQKQEKLAEAHKEADAWSQALRAKKAQEAKAAEEAQKKAAEEARKAAEIALEKKIRSDFFAANKNASEADYERLKTVLRDREMLKRIDEQEVERQKAVNRQAEWLRRTF